MLSLITVKIIVLMYFVESFNSICQNMCTRINELRFTIIFEGISPDEEIEMVDDKSTRWHKGSSINEVTVLGGGVNDFVTIALRP